MEETITRPKGHHQDASQQRRGGISVADAARILGTTAEAVRQRVKRGSLGSYKVDKRLYVIVPATDTRPETRPDGATEQRRDNDQDAMVRTLQERITGLERELERWQQQAGDWQQQAERQTMIAAEQTRIASGLLQRLQLEAPRETAAAAVVQTETREEASPAPTTRRPWWRFW